MRLLLDTHTCLWFLAGDSRLSTTTRAHIEDMRNERLLSIASLWEISIKMSLGKLLAGREFNGLFPQQLTNNAIDLLPIEVAHLARVAILPQHHRDPFDRLLIAQALAEKLPILSADPAFDAYGVHRIW